MIKGMLDLKVRYDLVLSMYLVPIRPLGTPSSDDPVSCGSSVQDAIGLQTSDYCHKEGTDFHPWIYLLSHPKFLEPGSLIEWSILFSFIFW